MIFNTSPCYCFTARLFVILIAFLPRGHCAARIWGLVTCRRVYRQFFRTSALRPQGLRHNLILSRPHLGEHENESTGAYTAFFPSLSPWLQAAVAIKKTEWQEVYPMDFYSNKSLGPWAVNHPVNQPARPARRQTREASKEKETPALS